MANPDHLAALELRLSHERVRLANAKSDNERQLRLVWIRQIEGEIATEKVGHYQDSIDAADDDMSDDELLRLLEE